MVSVTDISWSVLLLFLSTLLIPLGLSLYYQLKIEKELIISVNRMAIQLILVGIYLEYLFHLNSLSINLIWLLLMIFIGASSIVSKAHLPKTKLLFPVLTGLMVGLFPLLSIICLFIVNSIPFYNAQYLIPLAGMLLGNSLSGNIVALQNLFVSFEQRKAEYEAAISLGAPVRYACQPFVREAIQKSLAPSLASMSTMGIVTLPGMMTGQILSGASPLVAIKYQLMIMIAIFVMLSISVSLTLSLTIRTCINKNGRILVVANKK